jgi:hypothetical protein
MNTPAQEFLQNLAAFPPDTFENRFSEESERLGLGNRFDRNELTLLFEATFRGALCQRAVNGGEHYGEIRPEGEARRTLLEWDFMTARTTFFASPGWQSLPRGIQKAIERVFLMVFVAEEKLR